MIGKLGVVVERVVPHDHRESPFQRWGHDVGAAGELAAPEVHRLVHGAALEQVVALVRAAARVEKREHARDEQRRLVVRDGVGPREDRGGLAVLAVRIGEERADVPLPGGIFEKPGSISAAYRRT